MANIAMCFVLRSARDIWSRRFLRTSFQLIVTFAFFFLLTLAVSEGVLVLVAGDGSAPCKGMS
jgi:hypothetical protein